MAHPEQTLCGSGEFRVSVKAGRTPLVVKPVALMARKWRERGIALIDCEAAQPCGKHADLILDCRAGIGTEGFAIARAEDAPPPAWRITGNDERGLLYGVGKFLRGCQFGGDAGAQDGAWRYLGEAGTWRPCLR